MARGSDKKWPLELMESWLVFLLITIIKWSTDKWKQEETDMSILNFIHVDNLHIIKFYAYISYLKYYFYHSQVHAGNNYLQSEIYAIKPKYQ